MATTVGGTINKMDTTFRLDRLQTTAYRRPHSPDVEEKMLSVATRAAHQRILPSIRMPTLCSCPAQECAANCASLVTVRLAGAAPSTIAEMIRGETNASGVNNRICLSTLPSRAATSDKDPTRV